MDFFELRQKSGKPGPNQGPWGSVSYNTTTRQNLMLFAAKSNLFVKLGNFLNTKYWFGYIFSYFAGNKNY